MCIRDSQGFPDLSPCPPAPAASAPTKSTARTSSTTSTACHQPFAASEHRVDVDVPRHLQNALPSGTNFGPLALRCHETCVLCMRLKMTEGYV
eukprot:13089809-Alexandrium_andersonii.AAC.1